MIKNGEIYGVNDYNVFKFDPETHEVTTIMQGLNAGWYNEAQIVNVENSDEFFTVKGRDLLRVNLD